jgi:hypothetical protein
MINLLIFLVLSHQCQENVAPANPSRLWKNQQNRARVSRNLYGYNYSYPKTDIEQVVDFHQKPVFGFSGTEYTPLHNTFGVTLCDKYTKKVDCEKCWDGQDEYFCSRCKKAYHTKYDTKTIYIYTDWIYGNNSIFTSWTKNVDTLAF